jgi:hypothetical protein
MKRALVALVCLSAIGAGCTSDAPPPGSSPAAGSGGGSAAAGSGGSGGRGGPVPGGSGGSGGGAASGGSSGSGGGNPVVPDAGTGGSAGTGGGLTPDAGGGATPDAAGGMPDAGPSGEGSPTPMNTDGGVKPSYEGEIPIHYGAEVGPAVMMNCPEDPTAGWTEYRDSFHIERPYNVPINTRFSITGGIYNFWVFPGDRPHSTIAKGRNPRTEATYGGTFDKANVAGGGGLSGNIGYFTTGKRMYSADMLIERNAVGSAIMQIHTTAAGGGPIGLRVQGNSDMVNNGSLTVVTGSSVPGGLIDKWFNFKASLDANTLEVNIYINNCLKKTYKGDRGDGKFYFKNGVYFCKTSQNGCFSHYKNVHLYKK